MARLAMMVAACTCGAAAVMAAGRPAAGARPTLQTASCERSVERWTVAREGVAARFYRATVRPRGAAVLLLTGSEGGYPPAALACSLAEAGHAVAALAYFAGSDPTVPGIPRRLERVPLEYFDQALDRLGAVSGQPLAVIGESRGAEAALLVASRRPDVRLVIAFAPTSTVWQSPGTGGRQPARPAWTSGGQPLPFAIDRGALPRSVDSFAAALTDSARETRIPVERIRARTMLVAGGDDRIWPSLVMARDVARQIERHGGNASILSFPAAGHLLMGPGPGESRYVTPDFTIEFGGTDAANRAARDAAWRKTRRLLDAVRAPRRRSAPRR